MQVNGDGTPHRSYLYAADLAIWLWTILFRGKSCRPYNVGSEADLTIKDLAHTIARVFQPQVEVRIAQQAGHGKPAELYVPLTRRAQSELGLAQRVALGESIRRTMTWHIAREKN
jgi:nucleoside-diphosphate-sugar epimerase